MAFANHSRNWVLFWRSSLEPHSNLIGHNLLFNPNVHYWSVMARFWKVFGGIFGNMLLDWCVAHLVCKQQWLKFNYYRHKAIVIIGLDCGVPMVHDSGGVSMEHIKTQTSHVLCLVSKTYIDKLMVWWCRRCVSRTGMQWKMTEKVNWPHEQKTINHRSPEKFLMKNGRNLLNFMRAPQQNMRPTGYLVPGTLAGT